MEEGELAGSQILFMMKSGQLPRALEQYQKLYEESGAHRIDLLREIGLQLLFEGSGSRDPEVLLMTLFGAGISANERVLPLLEEAFKSPHPQHQLVALSFLARYQNDRADKALLGAMRSEYLPIRLEAALFLCEKQCPGAVSQTESLMHKVPEELLPLFAQLYAAAGTHAATRHLKRLMSHTNGQARIAAVLSAAAAGRDDLLPQVRTLAAQLDSAQQEACAFVLGLFKDESSRKKLEELSLSKSPYVRIAALQGLHRLGDEAAGEALLAHAAEGNLFAIQLLGEIAGSEETLKELLKSSSLSTRINATVALLKKRDPACIGGLIELLFTDSRDLAFAKQFSPGKSLSAWKPIPSASQQGDPLLGELSLTMREGLLAECIELPEKEFLAIAHKLLEMRQNDLVPMAVQLIENMQTPKAVELLQYHSQQVGAPLIRNYCNLALYRLGTPGPYYETLKNWIEEEKGTAFIKLRPLIPTSMREGGGNYQITPEERSRLLIEAFESFVRTHDDRGIDILLNAIRTGNPTNRYALAGLLIQNTL